MSSNNSTNTVGACTVGDIDSEFRVYDVPSHLPLLPPGDTAKPFLDFVKAVL